MPDSAKHHIVIDRTGIFSKEFGLFECFTRQVATIDKVRPVETFVVHKRFNLKVPLTGESVPATAAENN